MKGREITCVKLSVLSRCGAFSWAEEVNMKVYWGVFIMARREGGGGKREKGGSSHSNLNVQWKRNREKRKGGLR